MRLLILLGLFSVFCFNLGTVRSVSQESPNLAGSEESTRIPPPQPPICSPLNPTKSSCIYQSCVCGWCLPEGSQTRDHDPPGHCFIYGNYPPYIEKECGSVNATVHTHVNSKYCHVMDDIYFSILGIVALVIIIVSIGGCLCCLLLCIASCCRECDGKNGHDVTMDDVWDLL